LKILVKYIYAGGLDVLYNIIGLLQDTVQFILQALSQPAWQGVGVIISIVSIFISLVSSRKATSNSKRNLKDVVVRKVRPNPLTESVTHLPKSIPLLLSGSLVSTGMNISAEKIYTISKPLDKITQLVGRVTCVTDTRS
jgi:hypothetical protein